MLNSYPQYFVVDKINTSINSIQFQLYCVEFRHDSTLTLHLTTKLYIKLYYCIIRNIELISFRTLLHSYKQMILQYQR